MKKRLFPFIVALAALSVAGSAAFYSVFGLSKLFAGASTQVIIMAGSLEFAKLVVASLLYQYWDTINKWLRSYLAIAVFVLMVITSGGIYGFLSGAYQSTATKSELLDKSLLILEQKQVRFEDSKEDLTLEKIQINQSISDLRTSLSNPHSVSWYDKNSETVITSSSGSARRALQAELKTTITDRDNINLKLEAVLDSIGKTDMALLEKEISNEDQRELGPLKYLASTTGWPMDKVVNYFLLLIIFVFDPLAIALVVSANMAFAQIAPKRKEEDYFISRNEHLEKIIEMEPPVGLREEDNTTEPSESLKQRVKENQDKLKEIDEDYFSELEGYMKYIREEDMENLTYPQFVEKHYPKTEDPNPIIPIEEQTKEENLLEEALTNKRMDIIGQNGNDGLHYEEEEYSGELERLTDTTQTLIVEKKDDDIRVIKSNEDLSEEELIELSKEIGKKESYKELEPMKPTEKDLEKLATALSISKKEDNDNPKTLRYKGR
tara:strand:+ start:4448 stop:5926 length:1479 start_codon:yes stop_codon:yes gene_type:complete